MRTGRSIKSLLVALIATVALLLAGLSTYSVVSTYLVSARHAEEVALNLADVTAVNTRLFADDTKTLLERLAETLKEERARETCAAWIGSPVLERPRYSNILVVDAEGRPICSSVPGQAEDYSAAGRPWFEATRSAGTFSVGKPQRSVFTDSWITAFAYPMTDSDGRFVGVVGASVDLSFFKTLVSIPSMPTDAVITLADREGTVIARSADHEASVGSTLPMSSLDPAADARGFGINHALGAEGIDRLWGFRDVVGTPWRVYAGVPTEQIYGAVRASAGRQAAVLIVILAVVGLLTGLVNRRVSRSLTGLVGWARAAASRRWDGEMPAAAPLEIAEVAKAFGQTLEDRSAAEMRALEAKEKYRAILHNAVFGIYLSTPDGRFLQVNPALVRMLGYDSAEGLMAVNLTDLYQDPRDRKKLVREYTSHEYVDGVEVHWCRKDGTPIIVRLNGRALFSEQDGVHFEMIAEDVTEQKGLEDQMRQAQKMEAVGRLASAVAHDFNNILTVIVGQAQLMSDDGESASPSAQEIIDSGQRAARLTRQLLAFSRKEDIKRHPFRLDEVIKDVESMLLRLLHEDVELVTRLAPDLMPTMGEPGQIEQILMNLVVNAQDALPNGGRIVIKAENRTLGDSYVRSHVGVRGGNYVLLTVSDNGAGMSRSVQSKAFEPFFTTKATGEGSGLGLSTVYGIVTQSGGHIELASEIGVGTTFSIYLPGASSVATPSVSPVQPVNRFEGSETVLVVEDELSVRRVVCKSLERGGYRVLEAPGGQEGLDLARKYDGPIDLLLSDVAMPGLRGPELAERLVAQRPDLRVLFMSGYTDNPESLGEVAGAPASFLAKPFTPVDVLQSVWSTLQTHREAS